MKQEILKVPYNRASIDVNVYTNRRGPDWLFCIHGLQSNGHLFDGLVCQPFLSSYSTIAVDLVGFGQSAKPVDFNYYLEDQALVIAEIFRILAIRKAVLVGHSLGGMIGVLLLKSLASVLSGFINMEGNLVLSDCGASKEVADSGFADFQKKLYRDIKKRAASESPQRAAWLEDIPDYAFYKTSQSIVEQSRSGRLPVLFASAPCRCLFVCGEKNREKFLTVPQSVARCQIGGAGHFMLLDNPKGSYACLQEFLIGQSASRCDLQG